MTDLVTAPNANIPARDYILPITNADGSANWEKVTVQNLSAMVALIDEVLVAPAASINVPAIPANYKDLVIVMQAQLSGAADFVWCALNGDTAVNYQYMRGVFQQAAPANASGTGPGLVAGLLDGSGNGASYAGLLEAIIYNYVGTTFRKRCLCRSSLRTGTTANLLTSEASASEWTGTAAINQITLTPGSGNFIAGSRFTLYGRG